jgi:hypothetical protein
MTGRYQEKCLVLVLALVAAGMTACSSSDDDDSVSVDSVPVAYVKRPIDSTSREVAGNPTDSIISRPGSDLYVQLLSSGSAPAPCNITESYTQRRGDVSDPEVNKAGDRILFSMRGPSDGTWDIWEADVSAIVRSGTCQPATLTRFINDNTTPAGEPVGDDVDPAYLADGRIVFSSNRQEKTFRSLGRKYIDEYEREPTIVLHTMDPSSRDANQIRTTIRQISFNMSHDRNPVTLESGEIMFSRWDHVGERNQFTVFKVNPDGTGLFVLYGSHSGVTSYLHPREMPDGKLMSDAMPLSGTNEGGALMIMDVKNFAESNQPAPDAAPGSVGQYQPTSKQINPGMETSENGRFTTPYPLWDGSNRAIVSFTPGGRTEPVSEIDPITGQQRQVTREKTPAYGVYVIDLGSGAMRNIALPTVDRATGSPTEMIVDPVPLMPRTARGAGQGNIVPVDTQTSPAMASRGVGRLTVKSIYDTDTENRMTNAVLTAWERDASNPASIRIPDMDNRTNQCNAVDTRARYPNCDTRSRVANLMFLKDPSLTPADRRPGRFVRLSRAVPTVSGMSRQAIGETEFEMQQLLGYVPVEPDGSFSVEVPADTPIALSVTDAYGRAFQTHTSWLNVRPGETVTCKGCHSPRRSSPNALNQIGVAGNNPNSVLQDILGNPIPGGAPVAGETMAETRLRADSSYPSIRSMILSYVDIWTAGGLPKAGPITIDYAGLTTAQPAAVPVDGFTVAEQPARVINYADHVQPIWDRAGCAASGCHEVGGQKPDLTNGTGGSGRKASYDALLIGEPNLVNGQPVLVERDGEIEVDRIEPYVSPGLARTSRVIAPSALDTSLIGMIFPQGMKNPNDYAAGARASHAGYLNASEKRVIAEWIDLGAQYFNDPCTTRDASGRCTAFRAVSGLSEAEFFRPVTGIQALLLRDCAGCHVAVGRTPNDPPFQAKRLVLTGSDGDFSVTASMVTNVCNPTASYLLRYPTSSLTGNPVHPHIFDVGTPTYNAIESWITAAQSPANGC